MRPGLIWNNLYCRAHSLTGMCFCSLWFLRRGASSLWQATGKASGTSPADRGDIAATSQGQHWFFPGYVTQMNYRENEDTSASKCKLLTYLPQNANYIHPSQTCLFRKMSARPSLGRPGKRQLLKQHKQIWNLELLHLKSFTSTEYLWYGHWKAWNLFSASPSTDISVKDNRLRMIFILETKIDPKRKNNKGILCMSQKRFPERGEKGDWAVTERFQLPVVYREAQKHKQSPNLKGLVGIFHT